MTVTETLVADGALEARPRSGFPSFRLSFAAMQHADGLCQVALPVAALSVSQRPSAVAAVAFAARLPWLVFAGRGDNSVYLFAPPALPDLLADPVVGVNIDPAWRAALTILGAVALPLAALVGFPALLG